jgi:3-deoxy-D-manno-octulosonic-acid transferase
MLFQSKNRTGWRQRFGSVPLRTAKRPCIWVHAVSLGEVNATRLIVARLRAGLPQADVVVSTTTDTGFDRARELYPDKLVFRFPLDFSWVVRRVLRRIRPDIIVLMELEVWFNLVTLAARQGVRVCVVNGRFTQRSSDRLRMLGRLVRPMFERLAWVGAQTPEIARRFTIHGVDPQRIEVVGSLKWDSAGVCDHVDGAPVLAQALGLDRTVPLIVLGSSGPGEEELLFDVWRELTPRIETALAVVPRKPERFEEVAQFLRRNGQRVVRRSAAPDGCQPPGAGSTSRLILGDTLGELRKFYDLADVIVVGRSLVPMGGSDPMEAAALGRALIVGSHTENFAEPVERLARAGALLVVRDRRELLEKLLTLLMNGEQRREMGQRGQATVVQNQGATQRTIERLVDLFNECMSSRRLQ